MNDRTNDEVFAQALIRIIENQMKIKSHIGLVTDTSYYNCYDDHKIIDALEEVER